MTEIKSQPATDNDIILQTDKKDLFLIISGEVAGKKYRPDHQGWR
jgi:hypothetical protein